MKNQLRLLLILLISITPLSSCTNILFKDTLDSGQGLDFTYGAWLLNEIESVSSGEQNENFNPRLRDGLQKMGIRSITYIDSVRIFGNLPKEIPFYTNPEILKSIKDVSAYDYLINVKINTFNNESGGIAFGEQDLQNQTGIEIIVFDLNLEKKIYYEEMLAIETWPTHDPMENIPNKFSFTRSSNNLVKVAMRRILRDLKKNSKVIN